MTKAEKPFSEQIKEWDHEKLLGVLVDISWRLEDLVRRAEYDDACKVGKEVDLLKYEALQRMNYRYIRRCSE